MPVDWNAPLKISQLIDTLQKILKEDGDVPLYWVLYGEALPIQELRVTVKAGESNISAVSLSKNGGFFKDAEEAKKYGYYEGATLFSLAELCPAASPPTTKSPLKLV